MLAPGGRTVEFLARDGIALHARIAGDGEPVLLLHEFAAASACFAGFVELLDGCRSIALHARGYAPSAQPRDAAAYSQDAAVADCIDLLDALGLDRVHLVGASMGAGTGLLLALRHPERVRSAVLMSVGGGGLPEFRAPWVEAQERAAVRFETGDDPLGAARSYLGGASRQRLRERRPELFEAIVGELAEMPGAVSAALLRRVLIGRPPLADLDTELSACEVPLLVISGADDAQAVAAGNFLETCGMIHQRIEAAGHAPQLDQPEQVAGLVLSFLAGRADRSP